MSWVVYMIRCGDGALYTGVTNDLARRLREHQSGKRGAKYTRGRGPLTVAWSKRVADRSAALREEARIKKLPKRAKEQLVVRGNPLLQAFLKHCQGRQENSPEAAIDLRSQLVCRYSWAVPTEEALRAVAALSPIVEMGAGTGYWARMLSRTGADVVAYDRAPPGDAKSLMSAFNPWHVGARRRFPVKAGTPEDLARHPDRSLLLCWPPRGPMAARCLEHWKGEMLAVVGEFGGSTADDAFAEAIREQFDFEGSVQIPQWPGIRDSLTIWRRRKTRA